jgi:Lysozyme inhibitor LprI
MAATPRLARKKRSRNPLLCAARILIPGCILPLAAQGQSAAGTSPDSQAPPLPPPAVFQNPIPGDQLAFLNDYAGRPAKEAMKDKRFNKLLKLVIPRTEYHYGRDMPLSEASDAVLEGSKLPVAVRDGRYVIVSGKQGPYLSGMGFLWFDIQTGIALGGVYFHPVNGEPTPTLAIFSRQLQDHSLGLSQLPLAFAEDLSRWVAALDARWVSPRYFIPENGKKYVLLHDEDFCDHPANAPTPPQDACMQLNAEAADADLNAAYFMQQAHNAADATAWMMLPEHVSWIGFRDRACGLGPGTLPCRIRITRQRTGIILKQQAPGSKS